MFPGDSGVDQLVEIIKVLGTPSRDAISQMNPNYSEFKFPHIRANEWSEVFKNRKSKSSSSDNAKDMRDAVDLISSILKY